MIPFMGGSKENKEIKSTMRVSKDSGVNNNNPPTTKRQNTVKNIFLNLISHAALHPEKNIDALSEFLNNLYHKKCIKSQISPQKAGAFSALWDGALVIVNNIEPEGDPAAKDMDLNLLKDDLIKLSALFEKS